MRTECPNFEGTGKFAEGCRQTLRLKATAALDVLPVHSIFAQKNEIPAGKFQSPQTTYRDFAIASATKDKQAFLKTDVEMKTFEVELA